MRNHGKKDSYYENERYDILPFIPETCKLLLDIGCGTGGFGALVKEKLDTEVWGVEPIAKAADIAKDRLDKVLVAPFTSDLDLPQGKFDVVTFNDSLEHFPYPEPPLNLCHDLLAPEGVIVCSIPNVRYFGNIRNLLIEMEWKYEDGGILDYTHLRFFTEKSIKRTFLSSGYRIISISGINPTNWWSWKFQLLQILGGKYITDMKYFQYLVVAKTDNQPNQD